MSETTKADRENFVATLGRLERLYEKALNEEFDKTFEKEWPKFWGTVSDFTRRWIYQKKRPIRAKIVVAGSFARLYMGDERMKDAADVDCFVMLYANVFTRNMYHLTVGNMSNRGYNCFVNAVMRSVESEIEKDDGIKSKDYSYGAAFEIDKDYPATWTVRTLTRKLDIGSDKFLPWQMICNNSVMKEWCYYKTEDSTCERDALKLCLRFDMPNVCGSAIYLKQDGTLGGVNVSKFSIPLDMNDERDAYIEHMMRNTKIQRFEKYAKRCSFDADLNKLGDALDTIQFRSISKEYTDFEIDVLRMSFDPTTRKLLEIDFSIRDGGVPTVKTFSYNEN